LSGMPVDASQVCCGGGCAPPGPDSCQYANDNVCDEPTYCPAGTDATDCADPAVASYCPYTGDGECDEVSYCPAGSDSADCCDGNQIKLWSTAVTGYQYHTIGTPVSNDADCSGAAGQDFTSNSCSLASNGHCDEPYLCASGTDTLDCASEGYEHGDSPYCPYAGDSECDEPTLCPAGSDTADCCSSGAPRVTDPSGRVVVAADTCCSGSCAPPGPNWCQYASDGYW